MAPTSSAGKSEEYFLLRKFIAQAAPIGMGIGLKEDITGEYLDMFPKERAMSFYTAGILLEAGFTERRNNGPDRKTFEYDYATIPVCRDIFFRF